MDEIIPCPACGSNELSPFQRHNYRCVACGQMVKAPGSLRIFLSYGHDANEELVLLIKAGLEARGHSVWFDRHDIKAGEDWRREITEGILDSQRVLSFLSRYSTRDPGVCLEEIGIAIAVRVGIIQTILVEGEREVMVPPTISHLQWLDMHDWKAVRDAGTGWEEWFDNRFQEIVRVVESEENHRFAGEIQSLERLLKPIASDSRIGELLSRPFVGRGWLEQAVEDWRLASDRSSRVFLILGPPGVGKSAFAAKLSHLGRQKVVAFQFCQYDQPAHREPYRIIRNLAFQLATRLPDYRKLLLHLGEISGLEEKTPAELFDYLLTGPLRQVIDGGRERLLVVVDALDEAEADTRNPFAELLASHGPRLPAWIGFVVTSRPEVSVTGPLQGLSPFLLEPSAAANLADLRAFLVIRLGRELTGRPDAAHLIDRILANSQGVFLYLERFCNEVAKGQLSLGRLDEFPRGLGEIHYRDFLRQFPDPGDYRSRVRPALRAVLAAREPLPVATLARLTRLPVEDFQDLLRSLGSLFQVTEVRGQQAIRPYHKSLADWLTDANRAGPFLVDPEEGHRMLRDDGCRQWRTDLYALANLPVHLAICGDFPELARLLLDPDFVREKRRMLGYEAIAADHTWSHECLEALTDPADRQLLQQIGRESRSLANFTGRQGEQSQVEALVLSGSYQDLVVVGAPGIGKTAFLKHLWFENVRQRRYLPLRAMDSPDGRGAEPRVLDFLFRHLLGRLPTAAERSAGLGRLKDSMPSVECLLIDGLEEIDAEARSALQEATDSRLQIIWGTREVDSCQSTAKAVACRIRSAHHLQLGGLTEVETQALLGKAGALGSEAYR